MSNQKNLIYLAIILVVVAGVLALRHSMGAAGGAAQGTGYVSGWFACKAHPGWLCKDDGEMKPDPNWKGEREADPRKAKPKLPPGPEGGAGR